MFINLTSTDGPTSQIVTIGIKHIIPIEPNRRVELSESQRFEMAENEPRSYVTIPAGCSPSVRVAKKSTI
jgi:hypothetical protein